MFESSGFNSTDRVAIKVINFIANYRMVKPEKISLKTELLKDLGVDGDDAVELIRDFATEFQVDYTRFDFSSYFGSEGDIILLFLFGNNKKLKALKVEDLVVSVISGELI